MTRFTDAMWAEIRPTYEAILDLPFNRELAAGTLSRERFVFYMVQDAHYLGAFARALATAAAKAITPEAQVTFATSAHEAIVVERALHEGFFREFGVSAERFAATRPSPTCAGYSDFLLATTVVHGSAGWTHWPQSPIRVHAMRTDSGRPSSSMWFRAWTAMVTSVA